VKRLVPALLGSCAFLPAACGQAPTTNVNTVTASADNSMAAAESANGANAYLLSVEPRVQADTLAKAVGDHCRGRTPFYMGFGGGGGGPGGQDGFWSLRCADGRSFVVQVHPDGTSTVLECQVLKALHAGDCFKKFPA